MKQDTKCAECGRLFDENVVHAAFQERFRDQLDYDERRDRLCFACACLTAVSRQWRSEETAVENARQD